jgi:hypothetical protein
LLGKGLKSFSYNSEIRQIKPTMSFASSSSSTPEHVITVRSNSYYNLGPHSEEQKSTSARHARNAEQHDDNTHSLPLQPFQNVYEITAEVDTTNLNLGCPTSWSSIPNVDHHPSRNFNEVKNGESYPSSAPSSPPLTDNIFLTSVPTTSKYEVSSESSNSHSHPKKRHFNFLSSIPDDLKKRLNPEIILKNCGSVARDHLASERTFLAYVHTSLALSCAGVAIVQLLTIGDFMMSSSSSSEEIPMVEKRMKRFAMPVGVVSQVLALCILFLGEPECVSFFYPPSFFFRRHQW